jgi:hypothetical protein
VFVVKLTQEFKVVKMTHSSSPDDLNHIKAGFPAGGLWPQGFRQKRLSHLFREGEVVRFFIE